jgi:hypothetical protein
MVAREQLPQDQEAAGMVVVVDWRILKQRGCAELLAVLKCTQVIAYTPAYVCVCVCMCVCMYVHVAASCAEMYSDGRMYACACVYVCTYVYVAAGCAEMY